MVEFSFRSNQFSKDMSQIYKKMTYLKMLKNPSKFQIRSTDFRYLMVSRYPKIYLL